MNLGRGDTPLQTPKIQPGEDVPVSPLQPATPQFDAPASIARPPVRQDMSAGPSVPKMFLLPDRLRVLH
jgi:hypothetical protein